jgi:hypothetical protein
LRMGRPIAQNLIQGIDLALTIGFRFQYGPQGLPPD